MHSPEWQFHYSFFQQPNHKFLTTVGWKEANTLIKGDILVSNHVDSQLSDVAQGLNDDQYQIFLGSFLGYGNVSHTKETHRYRLSITHGTKQSEYCKWKASMFNVKTTYLEENGIAGTPAVRMVSKIIDIGHDNVPSKKTYSKQKQ